MHGMQNFTWHLSSSAWTLSTFFPKTSTNCGNTCNGVVVAVTVGNVSLRSGLKHVGVCIWNMLVADSFKEKLPSFRIAA